MAPSGAVTSGPAGGGAGTVVPHAPSLPVVAHVDSVAVGVFESCVARTCAGPALGSVKVAWPSASLVAVALPAVTVAPARRTACPSPGPQNCSDCLSYPVVRDRSPGLTVAGEPARHIGRT